MDKDEEKIKSPDTPVTEAVPKFVFKPFTIGASLDPSLKTSNLLVDVPHVAMLARNYYNIYGGKPDKLYDFLKNEDISFRLPFNGFQDPNCHIISWYPGIYDYYSRQTTLNSAIILCGHAFGGETETWYGTAVSKIFRAYGRNKLVTYLFTLQFFGIQSQRFKGFTQYKNRNIDFYNSSLHHVLTNDEYLFFNKPVRASEDGEVIEIFNDIKDPIPQIYYHKDYDNISFSTNTFIGNYITVSHKGLVNTTYGGLRQNSMKCKIGDRVRKGDIIANVGCTGQNPYPFLSISFTIADTLLDRFPAITKQFITSSLSRGMFPFDTFYYYPLVKHGIMEDLTAMSSTYTKDIKYQCTNRSYFVKDMCLIKPAINTTEE